MGYETKVTPEFDGLVWLGFLNEHTDFGCFRAFDLHCVMICVHAGSHAGHNSQD
jgi:hypothetical protein